MITSKFNDSEHMINIDWFLSLMHVDMQEENIIYVNVYDHFFFIPCMFDIIWVMVHLFLSSYLIS